MDREHGGVERRRERRVALEAPLLIRRLGTSQPEALQERVTKNIGLAGVYFEVEADAYAINDPVMISVSVPEPQRRDFPFTRVAGHGRVVRVKEVAGDGSRPGTRFGVALEFGEDVTALMATPSRS